MADIIVQPQASPPPSTGWRGSLQMLLGLGLTVLFIYMMAPFIVPILLGGVLAILCYPAYERLKERLPKSVAAFFMTAGVTLGVLAPLAFTLYTAVYRAFAVIKEMRFMKEGSVEQMADHPFVRKILSTLTYFVPVDREWLHEQAMGFLSTVVENLSKIVANFLSSMPGLALGFAVVILCTYFFLVDGGRFLKFLGTVSPLKQERSQELYRTFEASCRGVVLGLFLSAIAQAILIAGLFLITGLPNALIIGFFTIIAGMIPVVGSSPIWISAALYLGLHLMWGKMAVMIIGGLIVSTIDNVIRPWVMKGHAEMHPLLALISVFGAMNLLGPTGLFLGPIIAAVFVSFLRILSIELRRESISAS